MVTNPPKKMATKVEYRKQLKLLSPATLGDMIASRNLDVPGKKKGASARNQQVNILVRHKFPPPPVQTEEMVLLRNDNARLQAECDSLRQQVLDASGRLRFWMQVVESSVPIVPPATNAQSSTSGVPVGGLQVVDSK
jgi:hypothetical protein